MLSIRNCTFKVQQDDFSIQVSCDQDPKFWFRLEIGEGQDRITDFFLGVFYPALGGDLLALCYNKIARDPQDQLVFSDILSSRLGNPNAIDATRVNFEKYAKAMLDHYGRRLRSSRVLQRRSKFDLILDT